jgi:poly-gamma-glutamate biosynthesis protein PgsC/CapC
MVIETIGLGMLASFALTETIGVAAGGIVVPGYFALALSEPIRVGSTLLVSLATYAVVKAASRFMLVFGRRMLLLGVLVGYLLGYVTKTVPRLAVGHAHLDLGVIGYVIPGLVAYWMNRQGIIETISTMLVAAVLTRLVMTVLTGGAF